MDERGFSRSAGRLVIICYIDMLAVVFQIEAIDQEVLQHLEKLVLGCVLRIRGLGFDCVAVGSTRDPVRPAPEVNGRRHAPGGRNQKQNAPPGRTRKAAVNGQNRGNPRHRGKDEAQKPSGRAYFIRTGSVRAGSLFATSSQFAARNAITP